jgi:hypothetical protein
MGEANWSTDHHMVPSMHIDAAYEALMLNVVGLSKLIQTSPAVTISIELDVGLNRSEL